tara:strand:- start:1285 stop:1674 length:390 start_codon:yes stop_codon:yes gene_type:complete
MMIFHIFLPILAAIIINIIIFTQFENNRKKNKNLPPGYIIGIVWMFILGLLGYLHYLFYNSIISKFIFIAIVYCLLYPFLTANLTNIDDIYNIIAFLFACFVLLITYSKNKFAAIPFFIWTLYVNLVLL